MKPVCLVVVVFVSGAVGGFFHWVLTVLGMLPALPPLPLLWLIPALIGLGALAGYIGVFVIAATDRKDVLRCVGVAIIFGLSWNSVLSAAQARFTEAALTQQLDKRGEQLFTAQKEVKSLKVPSVSIDIEKELK